MNAEFRSRASRQRRAERSTGMSIDPQTLIIIMLIIFIIGLMIGISLGRPRYPRLPPY